MKFVAGICFAAGAMSLYQDWLGQAGYMELVQNHWTSPAYSVPIALAALGLSFYLLIRGETVELGEED